MSSNLKLKKNKSSHNILPISPPLIQTTDVFRPWERSLLVQKDIAAPPSQKLNTTHQSLNTSHLVTNKPYSNSVNIVEKHSVEHSESNPNSCELNNLRSINACRNTNEINTTTAAGKINEISWIKATSMSLNEDEEPLDLRNNAKSYLPPLPQLLKIRPMEKQQLNCNHLMNLPPTDPKMMLLQSQLNSIQLWASLISPLPQFGPLLTPSWNATTAAFLLQSNTSSQQYIQNERKVLSQSGDFEQHESESNTPKSTIMTNSPPRRFVFPSPSNRYNQTLDPKTDLPFQHGVSSPLMPSSPSSGQSSTTPKSVSPRALSTKVSPPIPGQKRSAEVENEPMRRQDDNKKIAIESLCIDDFDGYERDVKLKQLKSPQYKCSFCSKAFPREKTLQTHLRVHTRERPFCCNYPGCEKRFAQSGQLRTHHRLHSGEKPYRCPITGCEQRFTHSNRKCLQHPLETLIKDAIKLTPAYLDKFKFSLTDREQRWFKWYIETFFENEPLKRNSFSNMESLLKAEVSSFEQLMDGASGDLTSTEFKNQPSETYLSKLSG